MYAGFYELTYDLQSFFILYIVYVDVNERTQHTRFSLYISGTSPPSLVHTTKIRAKKIFEIARFGDAP